MQIDQRKQVPKQRISVGIADKHKLFTHGLTTMLESSEKFQVTLQAFYGRDVIEQLSMQENPPDILLIGLTLQGMDVLEIVKNIRISHPTVKTIAWCMDVHQQMLIRMIREGCRGWLLKTLHPEIIVSALVEVHEKGYYNADKTNVGFRQIIRMVLGYKDTLVLSESEKNYLSLACSDLSAEEIVKKMKVAEKTLFAYWDMLCDKLHVESRLGLVLETYRRGLNNDSPVL